MAIMEMKRAVILARRRDRKPIMDLLQRMEVMEISPGDEEDDVFRKEDQTSGEMELRQGAQTAARALGVLEERAPEKRGMFDGMAGRKVLGREEYEKRTEKCEGTLKDCRDILELEKRRAETASEIPKIEQQLIALEPWLLYDLPLDFEGTDKTSVAAGVLPNAVTLEALLQRLTPELPEIPFDAGIVSSSEQQTCIYVVFEKKDAEAVTAALRKIGFVKPPFSDLNPAAQTAKLTEEKEKLQREQENLAGQIAQYAGKREDIEFAHDDCLLQAEKYKVLSTLSQSRRTFLVKGYVPAERTKRLRKALEEYDAVVEFSDPAPEEGVPVELKNNAFADPCSQIVEGYAEPARDSFDPSFVVALFYYIFYGIMLSDAAYGIILFGVTLWLLKKYPNMEKSLRRNVRLFNYCGIATTVAGFVFGSFFGDTVNVVATTFFNRPDIKLGALWFEPINDPIRMMVFCLAIAVIHLFTGLGCKLYLCLKRKDFESAFCDVILWYLLVGGLIVLLMTSRMASEMFSVAPWPAAMAGPAEICAAVGAIGIVLTGGRANRNWGLRIGSGLYSLYGVTSYLSDILSYTRLMALGLATGAIAQVFNRMGTMAGGGPAGAVLFIVVFFIGQTMNILINALGAYVHSNRLIYVEFFGKFYEGGGRKFDPFAVHTKYFKFEEEN